MIPMDFDNLLANRDMWRFQVRLSSKKTPKKLSFQLRFCTEQFIIFFFSFKRGQEKEWRIKELHSISLKLSQSKKLA